jgi:hypothetical protein
MRVYGHQEHVNKYVHKWNKKIVNNIVSVSLNIMEDEERKKMTLMIN